MPRDKTPVIQRLVSTTFLVFFSALAGYGQDETKAAGKAMDAVTQKPIENATVTCGGETVQTNREGRFQIACEQASLGIRATGYAREQVMTQPDMRILLRRFEVRGLYLSFWGVGSATLRNGVWDTAARAHLNAVVIDVKGDRGFISHRTLVQAAIRAGANRTVTLVNPAALLADLHRRGLYAIGRIVVFKDSPLALSRNDLGVKTAQGKLFVDHEGLSWTDPFRKEVWDYNISIAIEAAREGFDEIQFDYVRFPDKKGLVFARANNETNRRAAIANFLAAARKSLVPFNVFLSADNFGYVCWNEGDTGIGQCFSDIGPMVDYISPMLYPSSFQFGIPGVRNPMSDPYRIVFASLRRAEERTNFPSNTFRPWLPSVQRLRV